MSDFVKKLTAVIAIGAFLGSLAPAQPALALRTLDINERRQADLEQVSSDMRGAPQTLGSIMELEKTFSQGLIRNKDLVAEQLSALKEQGIDEKDMVVIVSLCAGADGAFEKSQATMLDELEPRAMIKLVKEYGLEPEIRQILRNSGRNRAQIAVIFKDDASRAASDEYIKAAKEALDLPKVIYPIQVPFKPYRPSASGAKEAANKLTLPFIGVVKHQANKVLRKLGFGAYVTQPDADIYGKNDAVFMKNNVPKGTGYALACAIKAVPPGFQGAVLVTMGDVPLVDEEVVLQAVNTYRRAIKRDASVKMLLVKGEIQGDPLDASYGRTLLTEQNGQANILSEIIETKDIYELIRKSFNVNVETAIADIKKSIGIIDRVGVQDLFKLAAQYYGTDAGKAKARLFRSMADSHSIMEIRGGSELARFRGMPVVSTASKYYGLNLTNEQITRLMGILNNPAEQDIIFKEYLYKLTAKSFGFKTDDIDEKGLGALIEKYHNDKPLTKESLNEITKIIPDRKRAKDVLVEKALTDRAVQDLLKRLAIDRDGSRARSAKNQDFLFSHLEETLQKYGLMLVKKAEDKNTERWGFVDGWELLDIRDYNSGVYVFDNQALNREIAELEPAVRNEYRATDIPPNLQKKGFKVASCEIEHPHKVESVDTIQELERVRIQDRMVRIRRDVLGNKDNLARSISGTRFNLGSKRLNEKEYNQRLFNLGGLATVDAYNFLSELKAEYPEETKIRVALGRDTRPSGAYLSQQLARGLLAAAKDLDIELEIIYVGVLAKPVFMNYIRHINAHAGINLTCSHNPMGGYPKKLHAPEFGGWEFCQKGKSDELGGPGGALFGDEATDRLFEKTKETVENTEFAERIFKSIDNIDKDEVNTALDSKQASNRRQKAIRAYFHFLMDSLDISKEMKKGLKERFRNFYVAVDENGSTAKGVFKKILNRFFINAWAINPSLSHDPLPEGENLEDLKEIFFKSILGENPIPIDLGISIDADADRGTIILGCTAHPEHMILSAQQSAALIVTTGLIRQIMNNNGKGKYAIVLNGPSSNRFEEIVEAIKQRFPKADIRIERVEVGEAYVVEKMRELEKEGIWAIGSEASNGGVIWPGSRCRDGLLALLNLSLAATDPAFLQEVVEIFDYTPREGEVLNLEHIAMALPGEWNENTVKQRWTVDQGDPRANVYISDMFEKAPSLYLIKQNLIEDYFENFESTFTGFNNPKVHIEIGAREVVCETIEEAYKALDGLDPKHEGIGGVKFSFIGQDGRQRFVWYRKSGTEPEPRALRLMPDAVSKEELNGLLDTGRTMFDKAVEAAVVAEGGRVPDKATYEATIAAEEDAIREEIKPEDVAVVIDPDNKRREEQAAYIKSRLGIETVEEIGAETEEQIIERLNKLKAEGKRIVLIVNNMESSISNNMIEYQVNDIEVAIVEIKDFTEKAKASIRHSL